MGFVETHGRPDTEALREGLPTLPRKQVPYRGVLVREFDLVAALARLPAPIVIDVHTALNVQHLESRADAVAQITGVPVRETVPDTILERADEIELIENLFDMTRLESGTLKLSADWTDVADVIHTVRERAAGELAEHEFVVDLEPGLPLVGMDIILMEQVLYNLLRNAALYTPKGTRVRLRAQREGNELVLAVMDRGPGLPAEELPRAFEKFRRGVTGPSTGLGLGLSICKGLVEAHRGSIVADNRSGGGLRVMIRLPIEPTPAILEGRDE